MAENVKPTPEENERCEIRNCREGKSHFSILCLTSKIQQERINAFEKKNLKPNECK